MMQELKANTEIKVKLGPVSAIADGYTAVTTLALGAADAAVALKHNAAAVTDISSNTFAAITGADGWYNLTLTAGNLDTEGQLDIEIYDVDLCLPVFKSFMVLSQAAWDSKYAAKDTGYMDVNVKAIGDATQTATDLKAFADSGYDPATNKVQGLVLADTVTDVTNPVNVNLATGSDSVSTTISSTETTTPAVVGTPTNTYTATAQEDGTYHSWIPSAGTLEFAYNANIGANAAPTKFTWIGYVTSINDTVGVFARNWVGGTWEQIGTINGTVAATIQTLQFNFTTAHVDTGANSGNVRVRFYSTGATVVTGLFTDRALVSYTITNQSVGYAEGALWYDNNATANTNTTPFVDATADNPVTTWAAIKTLIASTGIKKVHIGNGATVTLDANSDGYTLYGTNWTLALGGQSIEGTSVSGAEVTGIATSTVTQPHFANCFIGAVTLPPCTLTQCGIGQSSGTFTAGSAGDYTLHHCFSMVPGSGSPVFAFSGLAATTGINNRAWTGGSTWTLDSDCTLSHEVLAGGGTTITTGGGNAEIRGITRSLTLTMSAAETVQFVGVTGPITLNGTTTATVNLYGVSGTLTDNTSAATVTDKTTSRTNTAFTTWEEVLTAATHNVATSAGRRVREITTTVLHSGTAQAGATNSITLDTGASATSGTYDPGKIGIVNGTGVGQCRNIFEYDGPNRIAYVNRDWKVIPDATSEFILFADAGNTHVNEGKAQGGGASTITLNTLASSVNDTYKEQVVFIVAGTGADQQGRVLSYNGTSKVATMEHPWVTQPDATSIYCMLPTGAHLLTEINAEVDTALADYGANTVVPDAAGTAAALHAITDGLVTTVDSVVDAIRTTTDKLSGMLVIDGAVYQFTANALELAPSSGGDATLANQTLILTGLTDVKGTGFVKDTNSLINLSGGTTINWTIQATVTT